MTYPTEPTYCFLSGNTPLSAKQYLAQYVGKEELQRAPNFTEKMMDPSILADLWPKNFSVTGAKSVWEDMQRRVSVTSHVEAFKGSGLRERKPNEQSLQPQFVLCLMDSPE